MLVLAIDIGGTKISACMVEKDKLVSEILKRETPKTTQKILETICELIHEFKKNNEIKIIGIATAGAVNNENSKVIGSTGNLPSDYSKTEWKKILEEKYNCFVLLENDANAAAFAERECGAAKEDNNSITITLGTGVGGGIVIDNKLLKGKSGAAAEIGHIVFGINKNRKCTCGIYNCFESYASGTGFAKTAQQFAKTSELFKKSFISSKNPNEITTYDIIEGLNNNDEFCKFIYSRWQEEVICGIISLQNIFDTESIILSGGMAKFIDYDYVNDIVNKSIVTTPVKIKQAAFDNNSGMIGAAALAVHKFKN
jgi:glucokinase